MMDSISVIDDKKADLAGIVSSSGVGGWNEEAQNQVSSGRFDIVVLDIMGVDECRWI
jgi:DNA-binding response OmpR family regulator